jgi:cell division protein FtsI (penicillin-binding protein 3)
MGQEIGVTPVQLVSMVSTIANGGTYLPPHILVPAPSDPNNKNAAPQAMPFKPGNELPNPLPPGAHRVISELASAQMRKMLEGVVLFGTGKPAQLNGYSAGGKTGTAQKIDPATHLYSKTMHIASFAGIAPVNNPAIAIAVVIDNPKGGSYYGTAVSAPVFAEVAQQVLEYLGVPHDEEVHAVKTTAKPEKPVREDDQDNQDINALYAEVNDLPSDDPLRAPAPVSTPESSARQDSHETPNATKPEAQAPAQAASVPPGNDHAAVAVHAPAATVTKTISQVQVPSLVGMPMRRVIEQTATSGLQVEIAGSGTVREQAPLAGTMVAPGTRIVVRGSR